MDRHALGSPALELARAMRMATLWGSVMEQREAVLGTPLQARARGVAALSTSGPVEGARRASDLDAHAG